MSNTFLKISVCLLSIIFLGAPPSGPILAMPIAPARAFTSGELIAAVNSLRASNGLPPYTVNPILMQVAQAHADYMAATSNITHYSADGSRPFQRALAAGYPVAGDLSRGGWFSENIQAGSGLSPSGAVSAWQGDAPHLNTMLSPNLFDVGAGVSQNGGTVYYVLDAGASGSSTGNPGVSGTITAPGTPIVSQFIVPVTVNTPDPDGNVYHEVQYGQTLWSIAIAYETKIDEIKSLNNLLSNDIQPGQRLLVKKVPTPLPALYTPTQGLPTLTATRTATMSATQTVNVIKTESPAQSELPTTEEKQGGGKVGLLIIICALGFAALGTWLGTRKPV